MEISPAQSSSSLDRMDTSSSSTENCTPIVTVTFVSPSSPAEECGLRKDDEILEFGSINAGNFSELKQISEIVMHRQNQQITLKVRRQGNIHELSLVPKIWSGRGLLGCNIVIFNSA